MKFSSIAIIALTLPVGLDSASIRRELNPGRGSKKSKSCGSTTTCDVVSPSEYYGATNVYNADTDSCDCYVSPFSCYEASVDQTAFPCIGLNSVYDSSDNSCVTSVFDSCPERNRNRRSLYDERELLTLLDENERGEALQAYAERQVPMHNKSNPYSNEKSQETQDGAPWASPSSDKAALLASDPGIWMVDEFLTNEESDKLIEIIKKNGHEKGMFGPCSDSKLQEKGHPHYETPNRLCFKISPETVHNELYYKKAQLADRESVHNGNVEYDGYDCGESGCSAETDPEDGAFLASIMSKVKDLWSTDVNPRPHVSVVLASGTAMPLRLHDDTGILASFVLYLSNGGAATVFPEAGVTIVPRKGSLATWLNMDKDGNMNPMAKHAVQAHPGRAGERVTLNIFIRDVTPEEFLISQDRRRLVQKLN